MYFRCLKWRFWPPELPEHLWCVALCLFIYVKWRSLRPGLRRRSRNVLKANFRHATFNRSCQIWDARRGLATPSCTKQCQAKPNLARPHRNLARINLGDTLVQLLFRCFHLNALPVPCQDRFIIDALVRKISTCNLACWPNWCKLNYTKRTFHTYARPCWMVIEPLTWIAQNSNADQKNDENSKKGGSFSLFSSR